MASIRKDYPNSRVWSHMGDKSYLGRPNLLFSQWDRYQRRVFGC